MNFPDFKLKRRGFFCNLVIFIGLSSSICTKAEIAFQEGSAKGESESSDEYVEPYLVTKTSRTFKESANNISAKLRNKLKSGMLKLDLSKSDAYHLPKEIFEESQLEGIEKCSLDKCLMKLNAELEIPLLVRSKNRKETFRALIFDRIKNYINKQALLGYEDRKNNNAQVPKMLDIMSSLGESPATLNYLKAIQTKKLVQKVEPIESWLRQEMVVIAPDHMQPILRVSEDREFVEGDKRLFFELPIYTDHYFDSSATLYEISPSKKSPQESILAITDVMEIDELKKTALIRAMFKGKMVQAVTKYQNDFLDSFVP
jgi:hypothetical protein